ncbi:hypothetical protein HHK36_031999 [Tetracentron sinense]|uniref:PB1 domain-containing protein n=1 Tax=Tetracentron sinense TaxID=13715 RepID=A0A835CXK4_TETSI|nr:hypothetical protein HHK36_031999 [Tetracentron sinense]
MASQHPSELESGTADSLTSSPPSDYLPPPHHRLDDDFQKRVRFMCSFGGRILPRPHNNQLRYVGGDTRIVSELHTIPFSSHLTKLSKLSGTANIAVKYQLPNEDFDALISVSTDEDVENMMEEHDRLVHGGNSKTARLRLFLFPLDDSSSISSLGSLLESSSKHDHWFFDALKGCRSSVSASLQRGLSEVSSVVSETPDYLFGLDNSEESREPKLKTRSSLAENVLPTKPDSPAPAISSPYCLASSVVYVSANQELPPVKTRNESQILAMDSKENQVDGFTDSREPSISQQTGYSGNPMWHYLSESHFPVPAVQHMPVYYVPGPVPASNVQVQQVQMQMSYIQRFPAPASQIPVGFRHPIPGVGQVYDGGVKPVPAVDGYEFQVIGIEARMILDSHVPVTDMTPS